jgi:hypothetical protein
MQVFLPYPDFVKSLESLDNKRLGKQRVETYQLISGLTGRPTLSGKPYSKSRINHPISQMFRDNIPALKQYLNDSIDVWVARGMNNTMVKEVINEEVIMPVWYGNDDFHRSHRANLLRKDAAYYGAHGWTDNPSLMYRWYDMDKQQWYDQVVGTSVRIYLENLL